jgi:hypothetical protein
MTTPSNNWRYLERDPKSSYKQLSVKGRRIKARTLYGLAQGEEAMTPEEVRRREKVRDGQRAFACSGKSRA